MTPVEFIEKFGKYFVEATEGTTIFPSVKAAQCVQETGWGQHSIGNNIFGIKADGQYSKYWKGASTKAVSPEVNNGVTSSEKSSFRVYNSPEDSIRDHTEFLKQNARYDAVFNATTPEEQAQAIQAAGYATDPNYAANLISIINKNDFKKLDKKKRS